MVMDWCKYVYSRGKLWLWIGVNMDFQFVNYVYGWV